ncbi:MAG: VPDSG-CTERM sorting domain-containing protein [Verrucomicrobiota bacterium]
MVRPNTTDGGSYMAVMSPLGEENSTLTQNPAVPAGFFQPVTLSFEFDLVAKANEANESPAVQGSTLNLSIGGISVFSETFAEAGGTSLSRADASGQTGWQTERIALSAAEINAIKTSGVDLEFKVDQSIQVANEYDFAAAIDNVALDYTAPDSSSTALLLLGVVSGICFVKRKIAWSDGGQRI